jgi:hypothetical protein
VESPGAAPAPTDPLCRGPPRSFLAHQLTHAGASRLACPQPAYLVWPNEICRPAACPFPALGARGLPFGCSARNYYYVLQTLAKAWAHLIVGSAGPRPPPPRDTWLHTEAPSPRLAMLIASHRVLLCALVCVNSSRLEHTRESRNHTTHRLYHPASAADGMWPFSTRK